METLLQGIPGIIVYIDNILVTGATQAEHLKSLEEALEWLAKTGLKVKKSKCTFMAPSVSYLGHIIDSTGLHPLPDKVQAIEKAPTLTNVTELKSYLGLQTYYGKFLPHLATRPPLQVTRAEGQVEMEVCTRGGFCQLQDVTDFFPVALRYPWH